MRKNFDHILLFRLRFFLLGILAFWMAGLLFQVLIWHDLTVRDLHKTEHLAIGEVTKKYLVKGRTPYIEYRFKISEHSPYYHGYSEISDEKYRFIDVKDHVQIKYRENNLSENTFSESLFHGVFDYILILTYILLIIFCGIRMMKASYIIPSQRKDKL